MFGVFQAIVLGVVEGLTEFLPISSTAHLILATHLLHIPQTEYVKSFEIVIQLGAILAVVVLYWRRFLEWEVLKRLAVAFVPTGVIGFLLYKIVKRYLLGNVSVVLWALAIGGALLFLLEQFYFSRRARMKPDESEAELDLKTISYGRCLALGLFQTVALVPGVSRSAATIIGGMLLGLRRRAVVEFSFLLAVPTMAAATGLDLMKSAGSWSGSQVDTLMVGFLASFAMAVLAIHWLMRYVQHRSFAAFGLYRIVLVIAFVALMR